MISSDFWPIPSPLLGHHGSAIFPLLDKWEDDGKFPPVLLITGTTGIGKHSMVYYIAQRLLCERSTFAGQETDDNQPDLFGGMMAIAPKPEKTQIPCGECGSCLRAASGNWINFKEISPEAQTESQAGNIKIGQLRELKETMGFGGHESRFKITFIREAECMTAQAANTLLKLLEEPPPGWVFFLTAKDPSLLLPTLVSRCQVIRLSPLPPNIIAELLAIEKIPEDRRMICARLAQGSWDKALALAQDDHWQHRSTIFRFIEQPQSQLEKLLDWSSKDHRNLVLLIDQMEQILSDLIQWSLKQGNYDWVNSDGAKSLSTHAKSMSDRNGGAESARAFWLERAEELAIARRRLSAPLNRKLFIQELLIPWLGVL